MKYSSQQPFGHFLLLDPIHEGPESVLFRAQDRIAQRLVALRIIDVNRLDNRGAERLARCRRDINAVSTLDYPGLLEVYEVGDAEASPYISTALCDGPSLAASLYRLRLPDPDFAVRLVLETARTLARVHQQGVFHGNVKPSNLIRHEGRYRLTDFGVVHLRVPRPAGQIGARSRWVLAPEQREGNPGDARTDVYLLAAVLYRLVTGTNPPSGRAGRSGKSAQGNRLTFAGRDVPPPLQQLIRVCMAPEPARRPRDCLEMSWLLEKVLAEDSPRPEAEEVGRGGRVVMFSPPPRRDSRAFHLPPVWNAHERPGPAGINPPSQSDSPVRLEESDIAPSPASVRRSEESDGWPMIPGAIGPDFFEEGEREATALEHPDSLTDRPPWADIEGVADFPVDPYPGPPPPRRRGIDGGPMRQPVGRRLDTNTIAVVAAVAIALVVSATYWMSYQTPTAGGGPSTRQTRTSETVPPQMSAPQAGVSLDMGSASASAATNNRNQNSMGYPTPSIEDLRVRATTRTGNHAPIGPGTDTSSPRAAEGTIPESSDPQMASSYSSRNRNSVSPTPMTSPSSSRAR